MFNELEALIFLSNNNLLSENMMSYYRDFIIESIEELPKEYPDVAKAFTSLSSTTFKNLRNYYEEKTRKAMSF